MGDFVLPPDLKPGEWRWLSVLDLEKLGYAP
jgi:16S rRNA pseudouridine516 synthase